VDSYSTASLLYLLVSLVCFVSAYVSTGVRDGLAT